MSRKSEYPAPTSIAFPRQVTKSLEGSRARLRLDQVDIFHLQNAITETGGGEALSVQQVLDDVVPAFERLRQQGKIRFLGLTAIGDTAALHQVIDARVFDSAQVVYNMLNPSAATELPPNYPAQDYGRLFDHTKATGVGVIGIRVLAGGARTDRLDYKLCIYRWRKAPPEIALLIDCNLIPLRPFGRLSPNPQD